MPRKKRGQKKLEDMLSCGIQLLHGETDATVYKLSKNRYKLVNGSSTTIGALKDVMSDALEIAPPEQWLGIEPEHRNDIKPRKTEVLTLDLSPSISKRRGKRS